MDEVTNVGVGAAETLRTFAGNFEGFQLALLTLAALTGFYLITVGLFGFATYGRRLRQGQPMIVPFGQSMAGTALLGLAAIVQRQNFSIFPQANPRSILDFADPSGSEAAMLVTVLLGLATFFGWIGIFRGWFMLASLGSQGSRHSGADILFVLIVSTLMANPLVMSDVIAATFGAPNYLRLILGDS